MKSCKKNPFKDICEKIYEGIIIIPKLFIIAIIVSLLSVSPLGNLIRCKLLDSQGCKPKIVFDIYGSILKAPGHRDLAENYKIIDKPMEMQLSEFIIIEYSVKMKNKGYESLDTVEFRVKPLLESTHIESRLLGYSIQTGLNFEKNDYDAVEKALIIKSHQFEKNTWWCRLFTKEQATVKIVVAYPGTLYEKAHQYILLLELECTDCQTKFYKKLVSKGDI